MESESDKLRVQRRSAKGKFARQVRTVEALVANGRSHNEVYVNWETAQRLYDELQERHESFCETIDAKDDATYQEEENWMEQCRDTYVKVSMSMNDYIRNMNITDATHSNAAYIGPDDSVGKSDMKPINDDTSKQETGAARKTDIGQPSKQLVDDQSSTFKLEFSQMPKFSGDVREYAVFRSDFKDLIEPKCSRRDAITLLRNSLSGKPYELIKGIGNDYTAAWEYLDSVYGDPRVIADAITYDITSFQALENDEDTRFCELCHTVRRSFNTLKGIGRQSDLDNNHMLAIIERKMARDDRRVWSRKVEEGQTPATLEGLLNWMTVEMKVRMRASALIREEPQSAGTSHVHCVSSSSATSGDSSTRFPVSYGMSDRCWICKSASHWVDECDRFNALSPTERMDMITENHACFCCLKRAGENHTPYTCYRRRRCMESNGNEPCKQYHHPLLHVDESVCTERISNGGLVGITGLSRNSTMLPVLGVCMLGKQSKRKSVNLLLDSGAQISLIRTELAEELELSGEDVTITVNKVGGNEQTMITKRYHVYVQSMDRKHTTSISAIGIPYITDDISSVTDLNRHARQLKIPFKDIHRRCGPVDLLVGVDCPQLHTGGTVYSGNLIGRKTPLGWVVFGTDGQMHQSNRVLSVQASMVAPVTHTKDGEAENYTGGRDEQSNDERHDLGLKGESCDKLGNQRRYTEYIPCNNTHTVRKRMPSEYTTNERNEYTHVIFHEIPQIGNSNVCEKLIEEDRKMSNEPGPGQRPIPKTAPTVIPIAMRRTPLKDEYQIPRETTCSSTPVVATLVETALRTGPGDGNVKEFTSTERIISPKSLSFNEVNVPKYHGMKLLSIIMNVFVFTLVLVTFIHSTGQGYTSHVSVQIDETRHGENILPDRWRKLPKHLVLHAYNVSETEDYGTFARICTYRIK